MNTRQLLGITGALLLFVGVFMPIVKAPLLGDMNFFQNGHGDGVYVLPLAIGAFALAVTRRYSALLWPGLLAAAVLAFSFYRVQTRLSEMTARLNTELADNPFRGLAEVAAKSVQLEWGWAVMAAGVALVITAGLMREGNEAPIPEGM